jgi:signal transduction histidine kinase
MSGRGWPPVLWNVLVVTVACGLDAWIYSDGSRLVATGTPSGRGGAAAIVGYAAAGAVVLALRRRYPVPVFVAMWLHAVLAWVLLPANDHPVIAVLVALFTVALRAGLPASLVAMVAALVPAGATVAMNTMEDTTADRVATLVGNSVVYTVIAFAVWAAGRWGRRNADAAERLQAQAETVAREAVMLERGRIARELHDIVAHSVTVMVLQAAGAHRVVDTDVGRAKQSLAHIEDVGRQAMGELRRMLTVLRANGPDATVGFGAGQLGPGDIDQLLDVVRSTGVPARLEVTGEPRRLDPSVGLAVYRTVQEALTNVTKHAGPGATAVVTLSWTPQHLTVQITDDGRGRSGSPGLSTGHGLIGLRERISLLGGHLVTGPTPTGGFAVTATLPEDYPDRPARDGAGPG